MRDIILKTKEDVLNIVNELSEYTMTEPVGREIYAKRFEFDRNLPIVLNINDDKKEVSYNKIYAFSNIVSLAQGDFESDLEDNPIGREYYFISDKRMTDDEIKEYIRNKYATRTYTLMEIKSQIPFIEREEKQ